MENVSCRFYFCRRPQLLCRRGKQRFLRKPSGLYLQEFPSNITTILSMCESSSRSFGREDVASIWRLWPPLENSPNSFWFVKPIFSICIYVAHSKQVFLWTWSIGKIMKAILCNLIDRITFPDNNQLTVLVSLRYKMTIIKIFVVTTVVMFLCAAIWTQRMWRTTRKCSRSNTVCSDYIAESKRSISWRGQREESRASSISIMSQHQWGPFMAGRRICRGHETFSLYPLSLFNASANVTFFFVFIIWWLATLLSTGIRPSCPAVEATTMKTLRTYVSNRILWSCARI